MQAGLEDVDIEMVLPIGGTRNASDRLVDDGSRTSRLAVRRSIVSLCRLGRSELARQWSVAVAKLEGVCGKVDRNHPRRPRSWKVLQGRAGGKGRSDARVRPSPSPAPPFRQTQT